MSKLHHTEYKKNYVKYILNTIETDNEDRPLTTDDEKCDYIYKRFFSEVPQQVIARNREDIQNVVAEWLSGLALDLPYWNQDIVDLAIEMGSIDANPSENLQTRVLSNYWNFIASIILTQIFRGRHVPYTDSMYEVEAIYKKL